MQKKNQMHNAYSNKFSTYKTIVNFKKANMAKFFTPYTYKSLKMDHHIKWAIENIPKYVYFAVQNEK
jgi:hypothetical protein